MNNRITTPNKSLVDPAGRVVSSTPMPVTFEKQSRVIISRQSGTGTTVEMIHVLCNGFCHAWILKVPMPANTPADAPQLAVWGLFSPEGEQILGRGPLTKCQEKAEEFARTSAINMVNNQIKDA